MNFGPLSIWLFFNFSDLFYSFKYTVLEHLLLDLFRTFYIFDANGPLKFQIRCC